MSGTGWCPAGQLLRCDDLSLDLARLYQPTSAQDCSGAMRLVSCQSSQQQQASPRPLGQLLFDQLTPGQPYYLALSGVAPFVLTKNFTLCAQAALSLPTRPALARGALQAWSNPVPAGEILTLELPSMVPTGQVLQVEWLNTLGQVLPGGGTGSSAKGRLQISTAGRAPGLYLLRMRPADGPALPPVRVVVE